MKYQFNVLYVFLSSNASSHYWMFHETCSLYQSWEITATHSYIWSINIYLPLLSCSPILYFGVSLVRAPTQYVCVRASELACVPPVCVSVSVCVFLYNCVVVVVTSLKKAQNIYTMYQHRTEILFRNVYNTVSCYITHVKYHK
jgi:putative component of membrane protein insertase Oxa1/YidC/SpoIIIJ protein YidD